MKLTSLPTKPPPDGFEQTGGADDKVPVLEPALWKQLADAPDLTTFCKTWLTLQCGLIGGVCGGAVYVGRDASAEPQAVWPAGLDATALAHVASLAIEQRRGVAQYDGHTPDSVSGSNAAFAFPIIADDAVRGVVALQLKGVSEGQFRAAMRQLQWGVSGLRERMSRERIDEAARRAKRAQLGLDILSVALEKDSFASACRALVTEIAGRLGFERVSIGFVRNGHTDVRAISHSAQFGKQMNLVQLIGAAMDEAVDQRALLFYPPPQGEQNVTRAHADLAKAFGASAILTTPMFVHDAFIGSITFEAAADTAFDGDMIATLDAVAAAVGPILEEKRKNDRWLIVKIADSLRTQIGHLFGPAYALRKLIVLVLFALSLAAYFWTDVYRINADAVVEGRLQRSIVAPLNGFIFEAPARAGDIVKEGQLLGRLDDRDLVLERLRWVTERQRKVLEYEKSLGERNRTEQKIATTMIEQADAQIRLVDEQLSRTRLVAPFDGIVITGDQTQAIGAAVQRGQVLFELAPIDSYRIALDVDETQITDVVLGQTASLVVSSLPNEPFGLTITKLTPVSKASDGRNSFRVEGSLVSPTVALRPGMHGVAKIDIDRRRVIWIWTRSFTNWIKLSVWRWIS